MLKEMKMNGLDLERLKDAFTALVGQAEPSVLPAFLLWVDIKVAEYKTNGYMYSDPSSRYEGPWLRFAVDTVKYKLGDNKSQTSSHSSYHSLSSPDTTVQTEALELTKTPEKSKHRSSHSERDYSTTSAISKDAISSYSPAKLSLHADTTAYPRDASSAMYSVNSHHSPVYGDEASGIINLSVKSSQAKTTQPQYSPVKEEQPRAEYRVVEPDASEPLKLTLKVPSVYNSPVKTSSSVENSPIKRESHTSALPYPTATPNLGPIPDGYSSLRSLLQASKFCEMPPTSASPLPTQVTSQQLNALTSSPIKSDNDSCASSPGPADMMEGSGKGDLKGENDCPYCGKTFQYRSSYRRHLKIHQGVYTHICAACSRKFTRKEHFVRHKCNRKPNIPNRSATRVELNPNAIPPNGKLPVPKVAFPPNLDEQMNAINNIVPDHLQQQHSPMSDVLNSSATVDEDGESNLVIDEEPSQKAESRRKKSQPRKVIPIIPDDCRGNAFMADIDDDHDMMEAYDSPAASSPDNNDRASSPVPQDLSFRPETKPELPQDHVLPPYQSHAAALPTPGTNLPPTPQKSAADGSDTINTPTGTYQIEQEDPLGGDNKCIKVTKQSNYLKLRKEAQLINGQLCFVCPHCNKVFHRSSNFSRHMRIHRGIYSYICKDCNRGFYRKEHFQKHKCARKSMSKVWPRKTKVDQMEEAEMADMLLYTGEKENLAGASPSHQGEGLEEGIDLSSDTGDDDGEQSDREEGNLVVDETPTEPAPTAVPAVNPYPPPPAMPQPFNLPRPPMEQGAC